MRWVSSHLRAILKLAGNWHKLVKFLNYLFEHASDYSANTIRDGRKLLGWLTNKHFMALLNFNIDIMTYFKFMSKAYQMKYDCVIGHSESREYLHNQLFALKTRNGERLDSFLASCHCLESLEEAELLIQTPLENQLFNSTGCEDMSEYESSYVVYKNVILHDNVEEVNETEINDYIKINETEVHNPVTTDIDDSGMEVDSGAIEDSEDTNKMEVDDGNATDSSKKGTRKELRFDPLSTIRVPYVEKILANHDKYFPSKMLKDFDIFDQRYWDDKVPVNDQFRQAWRSLKILLGYFRISYKRDYFQNFKSLIRKLMDPDIYPDYCTTKGNLPSVFWMRVLGSNVEIDDDLRKLIQTLLVIPLGSSEAERAFS